VPGASRRGDPSAPDYPLDGRKSAVAIQELVGQLVGAGCVAPSSREVKEVVNSHVLTQLQPTYRQANRQRLRGGVQRYFRFFGCPPDCRLVGTDFDADGVRLHIVWEQQDQTVLVDELVTDLRARPGMPVVDGRLADVLEACQAVFGEELHGIRVCVLGAPARSELLEPSGEARPLQEVVK
jgi:hypothetical protein